MPKINAEDVVKIVEIAVPVIGALSKIVSEVKRQIENAEGSPEDKESLIKRIEEAQASIPAWEN